MRMTTCRSKWVAVLITGALAAPVTLVGQGRDSSVRTHVVRAGDTLWRIAQDSLGDGRRWREILRLNEARIPSPDRLDAGTRLVLPGKALQVEAPLEFRPAPAPPARGAEADTIVPTVRSAAIRRSIFYSARPATVTMAPLPRPTLGADTGRKPLNRPNTVRVWEYVSSPFVVDEGALHPAGRCVSDDAPRETGFNPAMVGSVSTADPAVRFGDRIPVAMVAGAGLPNGTRFLVARVGPVLLGLGTVVIPTGVVRIVASGGVSTPAQAEVIAQFEDLSCDDILLGYELPRDSSTARPSAVSDGPVGHVVWIEGTALLPSLQHAVIVNLGARDGMKAGDQVTLLTPSAAGGDEDAAIATIVRVATRASTAIIIRQSRAAIEVGNRARVTAKLP
jgi:hypothetical protein